MAAGKFDSVGDPCWQDGYRFEDGTPLGISHSLWDEISGQAADAGSLYSGTPVSHVPDIAPEFYSQCSRDSRLAGCSEDASLDANSSPRPKRRRMLEYPSTISTYKNDFGQVEYQVDSSQESTFSSAAAVYGFSTSSSSRPYSFRPAGAANNVTATPSTAAEHGWPSGFAVQQMMSGEVVVDQEGAWLDELHRHSSLLDYVPKFPKEEVDHCKFLADRPWADQACHLEQQTDQRVELSTDSGDGIHFHMNPGFVTPSHSPGVQVFEERPIPYDQGVQGPGTAFSSTPCSKVAAQQKPPQVVTPLPLCPFDVVKPLPGVEGNLTLEIINQRISTQTSMPGHRLVPADGSGRLVATLPEDRNRPTSLETGIGLSGKSVVSLRTIHTQGSGTVTIIRTKD